jgi:hypothetical protein
MKEFALTFVVSSESSEKLHLARQQAVGEVNPDRLHTDIGTAAGKVWAERHYRLRDYFISIEIAERDSTSFELVFVPHRDVDSYWKDVIVKILATIRDFGVSIRSVKQSSQ